jgi:hypothetical protein
MESLYGYLPLNEADAIKRSSEAYCAHDSSWHMPLVTMLTRPAPECTHAVVWDERCILRLLPQTHTVHRDSLLNDMDELRTLRNRQATTEAISSKAEAIWSRPPARDQIQTAVEQFFWAVAHELYPDGTRPVTMLGVGTTLIAQGEGYPDWGLTTAIEEFEFVSRQRAAGVLPSQVLNLAGTDHYGFRYREGQ